MTALLQLPFVAGVVVHVALDALPQLPSLHANVAEPVRQEAALFKVTLEPGRVSLALAEQLLHVSVVAGHGSQEGAVQGRVCRSAGLGVGQAVLPQGQLTDRVCSCSPDVPQAVALHLLQPPQLPLTH